MDEHEWRVQLVVRRTASSTAARLAAIAVVGRDDRRGALGATPSPDRFGAWRRLASGLSSTWFGTGALARIRPCRKLHARVGEADNML
jgi:hypothetical protein